MGKKAFEAKLAVIGKLRSAAPDVAVAGLRKALADRNNYVVAKAAQIAAELGVRALVPEMAAAFDHDTPGVVLSAPVLLTAIGLSRQPEAIGLLISLVETADRSAEDAIAALGWARGSDEIRAGLEQAVERSGAAAARSAFQRYFGASATASQTSGTATGRRAPPE